MISPGVAARVATVRPLTKKPWFGSKQWNGWGWRPVSWEGWLITLLVVGLLAGDIALVRDTTASVVVGLVILAGFVLLTVLTGDLPRRNRP